MLDLTSVVADGEAAGLAVRVRKLSKSYPGVRALRNVNFELAAGEVHGLAGANGAGKSTLIKMLSGASVPDSGDIEIHGSTLFYDNAGSQGRRQVAAIYQELTIIPEMSALSNAFLGSAPSRWFLTDRRRMERRFAELADWMGLKISSRAKAGTLSVANQQMLEIMRAVQAGHKILIMDEPTAPLGAFERSKLYDLIARLKTNGVSIIFISHDLDEVLRLSDRVSVMRDGQLIETRISRDWTKDTLVQAMLGDVKILAPRLRPPRSHPELFRAGNLMLPGKVSNVSLSVGAGEVFGIAGLVGAGRTEILRCLAGLEPTSSGRLVLDGVPLAWPRNVRESIGRGIVLAPEDRKSQGLVLSRSSLCNLMLTNLHAGTSGPFLSNGARRKMAVDLSRHLGFDPGRLETDALNLSGGNQQKLVLGKWLNKRPRVLLLDEPTRGIDLGAKQEIYQAIRNLSDQGMAVVLVSSDLEEVVEYSSRVLVLAGGRQIGILEGADCTVEHILNLIFAVERQPAAAGAMQ